VFVRLKPKVWGGPKAQLSIPQYVAWTVPCIRASPAFAYASTTGIGRKRRPVAVAPFIETSAVPKPGLARGWPVGWPKSRYDSSTLTMGSGRIPVMSLKAEWFWLKSRKDWDAPIVKLEVPASTRASPIARPRRNPGGRLQNPPALPRAQARLPQRA